MAALMHLIEALNTRNERVICQTLKVIQDLVESNDKIGEALVPYFRQILPTFQLFKNKNGKEIHEIAEWDTN
jgi:hypothetical protein